MLRTLSVYINRINAGNTFSISPALIHEFCEKEFYRQDYIDITEYFVDDNVEYRQAVDEILALADGGMFD